MPPASPQSYLVLHIPGKLVTGCIHALTQRWHIPGVIAKIPLQHLKGGGGVKKNSIRYKVLCSRYTAVFYVKGAVWYMVHRWVQIKDMRGSATGYPGDIGTRRCPALGWTTDMLHTLSPPPLLFPPLPGPYPALTYATLPCATSPYPTLPYPTLQFPAHAYYVQPAVLPVCGVIDKS